MTYLVSYLLQKRYSSLLFREDGQARLLVTIVLDYCFSRSISRTGAVRGVGIRSVIYVEAATPREHQDHFGFRDKNCSLCIYTLSDEWLIRLTGYTILSGCGPNEVAHELELSTGERRGAHGCFLMEALSALKKRGVDITCNHESSCEHMHIRFHASWPRQTPVRYGNKSFTVFGGPSTASSTPSVYMYIKNNNLCLDAGETHGVYAGDAYKLHPHEWLGNSVSQVEETLGKVATAWVDVVHCLTSDLANVKLETAK